ncbi:NDMA-dependent alcohol dehydrogenase, Rxyl_3153 family protein [Mycolicibacterium hassiacum DSM 44199]|jgi:S-(hydroxymethyl)glutathione dehydrogenase/alcohol dehydrogenase|uniref:alcohol dehydrogenase n=1 Tax=Mycolicibacterium hassiacum (strain DSM 44199 / CIP 105218 / JCM 12690 / 3849) TaxID=1122247 RepID=K5BJ06_MYCHD|nr:NDMA-dependent alcohol dehydrogenase [Mycolicibacterium hassiacum]EKF22279.1 NDMA-dependent alcohol dehydrogenase, Rxyl_3153 family protein [Mycolicibacterium hassiacum DSM 44199]MBX5485307.1 NDMA-dependent alcohol dehydrogenase [Mycolicibacterium hassiacum]MDA4087448.1 alcohol dehydrogenase [Mycolicibacterium hassiacum DSM 44199]PZN22901.1 MAG: NDMA-dependent alcohol dehydrogenase [Mycolicibacterium hassiacum]VCT91927.1 Alcohol dehydrogenase B [Mycolicibacterium hassiacum DSM 44199]
MKTKGALIWEFNQPWSVEEIEIGDPVKDEVKIRMETAGMCHSDHHLVTGGIPMGGFPVLGGHEGAGVVVEVGPGVDEFEPGDHVVLSFIPSCGQCPSCQAGLRNLCDLGAGLLNGAAVSDGTYRIKARGQNVYPMTLLGTFSPYMVVHKSSVVKIDKDIPFEVACLVGCGVTTGYGSAVRSGDIRPGDDVAIVGCGGVGIGALQGAVNAGARYIFAIDPVEWKREQALKFGATHAYPDVDSAMAAIAEITWGKMAQKVIVTVGELKGKDIDAYVNLTAKGGTTVLTAIGSLLDTEVNLNLSMLTLLQKRLQGTIFGGGNPHFDIPQLLSMYKAGKLNLDDMVTRQYKLEQINEGYQDMLEGRNIRGIIRYTEDDW